MPKGQTKKSSAKAAPDAGGDQIVQDESPADSQHSVEDEATPMTSKGKKRSYEEEEEEEEPQNFGGDMQKMLECFGADISKNLVAKRKRLETYTQNSLKSQGKKVEDIWKNQQAERMRLGEEFRKQVASVFSQWESDLEKTKDQEEKLKNLFKQQQKLFEQSRIVQTQRLTSIKKLHDQYIKGLEVMEKNHAEQQVNNVHSEMKKEMAALQKKILMDTQQQEMANVRKSLQTMLF